MTTSKDDRDPELKMVEETCREIGRVIKATMPDGVGFFLGCFTFGEGGWSSYISNGDREDMCKYLRELLRRLETS